MDWAIFAIAGAATLAGGLGVVLSANPVHSALMLVMTLFGVAVLFVAQQAHFLAAVQVIVYAGAIVVLFLFVIMLLGVDRSENLKYEPLKGQRPLAVIAGLLGVAGVALLARSDVVTGARSVGGPARGADPLTNADRSNIVRLAESLFTKYLLAFEITSVLLVIAVVGAVVLARRTRDDEMAASGVGTDDEMAAGGAVTEDEPVTTP
jgi:NADH-quinone oxidoreductase subunit J